MVSFFSHHFRGSFFLAKDMPTSSQGMISQEEYELRQASLLVIPEPRWFPKCEEIM